MQGHLSLFFYCLAPKERATKNTRAYTHPYSKKARLTSQPDASSPSWNWMRLACLAAPQFSIQSQPFSVASSPHSFLSLYNSLDKLQRAPTSKNQVRFQPLSNRGSFLCTLKNHLQVALQTQNSDRPGKHQYPAFTQLNQLTPDKPDKPDTLTVQTCSNMAP